MIHVSGREEKKGEAGKPGAAAKRHKERGSANMADIQGRGAGGRAAQPLDWRSIGRGWGMSVRRAL